MRKLIPTLVTATLLSTTASADMLGLYVGAGNWKPDFGGDFSNQGDQFVIGSSNDEFNVRDKDQSGFYIALEHPIPVLPNFMLAEQDMKSSGSGTFTGPVTFGGQTYRANTSIDSDFDLSHRDYTLYYEILDNWVNLDLGLTGRQFDGFVRMEGEDANAPGMIVTRTEEFEGTLPMLYGKARFDLPLTGLSASVKINYISASGNTISDTSLILGYESSIGLGLEGGIRTFNMKLEDEDDFRTDMEFDGVFVNLTFHF